MMKFKIIVCLLSSLFISSLYGVEEIDAETTLPSVSTSNATIEVVGQLGGVSANLVTDALPSYLASGYGGQISNQSPVLATPSSFNVAAGGSVNIPLSGSDLDGDSLNWVIVTNVSQGTLTGSNGTFSYSPNASYSGPDSFMIRVNDGADNSADITVSINVLPGTGTGRVIRITVSPDPGTVDMLNITTSTTVPHSGAVGATSSGNDSSKRNSFIFIIGGSG